MPILHENYAYFVSISSINRLFMSNLSLECHVIMFTGE